MENTSSIVRKSSTIDNNNNKRHISQPATALGDGNISANSDYLAEKSQCANTLCVITQNNAKKNLSGALNDTVIHRCSVLHCKTVCWQENHHNNNKHGTEPLRVEHFCSTLTRTATQSHVFVLAWIGLAFACCSHRKPLV